jgi:hypothetical protein
MFNGFCWSYGTVIVEFKKQNSTLSDTEMSMFYSSSRGKKNTKNSIQVGLEVLAKVLEVFLLH